MSFRSIPGPSEENSPGRQPEGDLAKNTSCRVARAKCACCWRGKHTRLVSQKCSAASPGFKKCACWQGIAAKQKRSQSQVPRAQEQSALVVGELSTRGCSRRSARQRALDSKSALVVEGVLQQNQEEVSYRLHWLTSKVRLLLAR